MSSEASGSKPKLTSKEEFCFLTELAFKHSTGEHTFVAMQDTHGGTTRFANNQIVQNVNSRRVSLSVSVAFGRRHGTASTTDLTAGSVQNTLRRAEQIARVAPPDPEYLAPIPRQEYPALATSRADTEVAGPARRLAEARTVIELCQAERLTAAGIVSSSLATVGLAADTGLLAYEERTAARFSITTIAEDSTAWAAAAHRAIDQLGVRERTRVAIKKAKQSANPKELPPGRYTVILEPASVGGLMSRIIWALDAKSYYKQTSPFRGKLGHRIMDSRLTLRNRPEHPALLGCGFNGEGLPATEMAWIESGVLQQLDYDRYTAQEHHVSPTPALDAPYLDGAGRGGLATDRVEELIEGTERGILVTNFWYIRSVNPTDLTLTGMTRDGTFLIEDGQIKTAVRNFRFHESPLRALNNLEAFTIPREAVAEESGKMLVPALKIRDFNFSSVTRF